MKFKLWLSLLGRGTLSRAIFASSTSRLVPPNLRFGADNRCCPGARGLEDRYTTVIRYPHFCCFLSFLTYILYQKFQEIANFINSRHKCGFEPLSFLLQRKFLTFLVLLCKCALFIDGGPAGIRIPNLYLARVTRCQLRHEHV